ncbi:hypothetical protein SK128_007162 [Halocaridina rubra]|uniref:Fibrinogen C-terminal domain-containing protein n=1 Tax=Halocaridina rubra TaxID=373956 RepID=A0AAN8ZP61_HALRR
MRLSVIVIWVLWAAVTIASTQEPERDRDRERPRGRARDRERNRERDRGTDRQSLIRPRQELVNTVDSQDPEKPEGASFLSIHTARHSELSGSLDNSEVPGIVSIPGISNLPVVMPDAEIARRQMDTIILLLQRLSDRLAALETLQSQRGERIDTIHYRLTKLELQAEERKSVINELSNSVRHRMETTDSEMDRVTGHLDEIKTAVKTVGQQNLDLKSSVDKLATSESGEEPSSGPRLQAVMASLYGVRSLTQNVKEDIASLTENLSPLSNISNRIGNLQENMVTKQYLHQNLNEIKMQQQLSASMPIVQPRVRQGQGNKEPEDCWKLLQKGKTRSGVYRIQPQYSNVPFFVYCDMDTDGGGWTVIQRREDGTVDFLREWADYKYGFGNLAGEFWLGNEKIHLLTNQYVSKLRVDLADFDQQEAHAVYSAFAMGSELEGYSLQMLGQYTGDAGDSLRYHVGRRFSTIDVDNDAWPERSCARDHAGAWWYRACETSNLNGRYLHGPVPADHEYSGLYWYDYRGPRYSLWRSRMMIRRGGNVGQPIFKDIKEVQQKASTERPDITEPARPTETPDPRGNFYNPDHDPYATYDYTYDPYG